MFIGFALGRHNWQHGIGGTGNGGTKMTPKYGNAKMPPLAAFSFGMFYSFFTTYFNDFANSPLATAARGIGADVDTLNICLLLTFVLGLVCCLSSLWTRLFIKYRSIKLSIHICAFAAPMLIPITTSVPLIYVYTMFGAFSVGALLGRSLYTAVCFSADIHPALIIVAIWTIVQAYIHANAIAPVLHTLRMYYVMGTPLLLGGVVTCYLFNGNEIKRRRVLPENKLRLEDLWPALAMIILAQGSFALYDTTLLPRIPALPLDPVLQIIPNAATLLFFLLFWRRLNFRRALTIMVAFLACVAVIFVAWEEPRRAFVMMFTEPSFLFYDLFYFWLLQYSFLAYGRRFARMKLFIVISLGVDVVFRNLTQIILSRMPPGTNPAIALLPMAFGLALLIPMAARAAGSMGAQREYAESFDAREVPLPDQREDVLEARGALLQTLPPGITLTGNEQTALAYLIDGQYTDVTAYFMDMSLRKVNMLAGSIVSKFGCKNKTELIARMGAARAGDDRRARLEALYKFYGLTAREREICELLMTTSLAMKNIAEKLGVSNATVNFHTQNLYRKLDIQSRNELADKFTGAE